MKNENAEDVKNPENPSAQETPVKSRKDRKKEKGKKPPQADGARLPVLVELTYTVSIILLIFVGLAMIIISFLTGASLSSLVLRTSVAILVLGSLLILISSQVSSGVLQASLVEQEEAQQPQPENLKNPESPANIESHDMAEVV